MRFQEKEREWRLAGLFYADDLLLCGESEKARRAMVGHFGEVCRRGLKVNAGKSRMMMFCGEKGLDSAVCVDGMRLEHVSECKYLGCVLEESGTDESECNRKVASGRRVAGAIRSLVFARGLQLECARVLHELLFVPFLMCGSETMIWKEKERSRIMATQTENLRGLLGIRRMDKVPNAGIMEFFGVTKGVNESIDKDVLVLFSHVERMENERTTKRVYLG